MSETGMDRSVGNESLPDDHSNPFEMPWYFALVYIVLYSTVVAVAVVGNTCVVYIIVSNPAMRNVTNYFIVNLSISDTVLALFNALFVMIYLMESNWIFGEWYCKVAQFLAPFLISASIFTYAAIATDRYMAIVHPLRPKLTSKQIIIAIVAIWIVSGAIGTPNFVHARELMVDLDRTVCIPEWPDGIRATSDKVYNIFLIIVNYVIPLIVVATTYAAVCKVLWGSKVVGETNERQEECVKAKRKVVKMMIFCVVIFATCWAPMHTYQIASYVSDQMITWKYINYVYPIIYLIAMSNTMYPPIVYCRLNAKFRFGFARILNRCFCCCFFVGDYRAAQSDLTMTRQRTSCFEHALPKNHPYLKAVAAHRTSALPLSVTTNGLSAPKSQTLVRNGADNSQLLPKSECVDVTASFSKRIMVDYSSTTKNIKVTTVCEDNNCA